MNSENWNFETRSVKMSESKNDTKPLLVGGWTTPLKNVSQSGSFPQVGVKIKNLWNHHLD